MPFAHRPSLSAWTVKTDHLKLPLLQFSKAKRQYPSRMPRPLPSLYAEGEEPLKDTRDPIAVAQEEFVDKVRQWMEFLTNGDPGNFWTIRPIGEALAVMEEIIKGRLALSYPYNHKALLLAQLIPEDNLASYVDLLKPLTAPPPGDDPSPNPNPSALFVHSLAVSLHATAEKKAADAAAAKAAAEAKAKEDEEVKKWQAWSEMYGYTRAGAGWRPHPGNPEWTRWVWEETGPEEWWVVRKEEAK